MNRVTVLERGRIERDDDASEGPGGTPSRRLLPARLYDRLLRSEIAREERGDAAVFQLRHNHCLVGPWVGVIQIPGLQLEILPKINDDTKADATDENDVRDVRGNLLEMLHRGGFGAVRARGAADLSLKRGGLHDQLVDAFLDRTLFELRRGLDRGYITVEDNLATLRGKLVLSRHVIRNAAQKDRFFCRHDVLTEATQISIRLKQACRALSLRALALSVAVKCQKVLALLDDVPDLPFHRGDPDPVFTRQNERLADIYDFACMLLEGQAPDARAGRVETFSLLFNMEQVFERYIAAFLAAEVMPGIAHTDLHPQAKKHRLNLFRDQREERVLHLEPDLLFIHEGGSQAQQLVVDTKWKRLSAGKKARPDDADLYQLYAYLHRYDCRRAFLLYPLTADVSIRDLHALARPKGDHVGTVGVRFVRLHGKLWTREGKDALARELEGLVREGLDLPAQEAAKASA